MHPIVADQIASQFVTERRREADLRRRVADSVPQRTWRARQARRLLGLARRLDPSLDRRGAPRAATAR